MEKAPAERPIKRRWPMDWLEMLLGLSILSLVLQLVPGLWDAVMARGRVLVGWVDVRAWSRGAWVLANVVLLVVLAMFRFRTTLRERWSERHERAVKKRATEERRRQARDAAERRREIEAARRRRIF